MAIANGRFPLIEEPLIWEYHFLGERIVELLGLFQNLWNDVDDFVTARRIFEKICSNEKIDWQKFENEEQKNRINFVVLTLENFINFKEHGDFIIDKLAMILVNSEEAEECGKFLMGKALKVFFEKIRDFEEKNRQKTERCFIRNDYSFK